MTEMTTTRRGIVKWFVPREDSSYRAQTYQFAFEADYPTIERITEAVEGWTLRADHTRLEMRVTDRPDGQHYRATIQYRACGANHDDVARTLIREKAGVPSVFKINDACGIVRGKADWFADA